MNEAELCPEVSRSDGQWNLIYRHTTYPNWAVEVEHEDGERRFVLVNARDGRRLVLRSANSLYPALDLAAVYLNHKETDDSVMTKVCEHCDRAANGTFGGHYWCCVHCARNRAHTVWCDRRALRRDEDTK